MGQPPRIREVSLKVLRLSAPCGSCWSWFVPFVITLRILPPTALWRCEDNSHGPGSLGLKIPYSGQSCSVQLGHEGMLMPSHWWTYHLENLLRETLFLQCSARLEFFGSKNIIFWTAHWERVCSPSGWMWGMRKGILVSGKGGCVRGWWRSTYLVPSCFLKSPVFLAPGPVFCTWQNRASLPFPQPADPTGSNPLPRLKASGSVRLGKQPFWFLLYQLVCVKLIEKY